MKQLTLLENVKKWKIDKLTMNKSGEQLLFYSTLQPRSHVLTAHNCSLALSLPIHKTLETNFRPIHIYIFFQKM